MCRPLRAIPLVLAPLIGAAIVAQRAGREHPAAGGASAGVPLRPGRPAGLPDPDSSASVGRVPVPDPAQRLAAAGSAPHGADLVGSAGASPGNLQTLALLSPSQLQSPGVAGVGLLGGIACGPRHSLAWMAETDAALQTPLGNQDQDIMYFWVRPPQPGWHLIAIQYSPADPAAAGRTVTLRHREAVMAQQTVPRDGDFCVAALASFPAARQTYWFRVTTNGPVVFHRLLLDRVAG